MGEGSVEVAPLFDQLALVRFMHDRCAEAVAPAQRAWDIMAAFLEEDRSPSALGATAAAAVRFAAAAVGAGEPAAAAPVLQQAGEDLKAALEALRAQAAAAGGAEAAEAVEGVVEKLETAQGECGYYAALCALGALGVPSPDQVAAATPALEAGLQAMQRSLGRRHPLVACALREHNK
jgi:hypothetical protein